MPNPVSLPNSGYDESELGNQTKLRPLYLEPLLPDSSDAGLEESHAVRTLMEEAEQFEEDNTAVIVYDDQLAARCLEITGQDLQLMLSTQSILRSVVLQIKNLDLYFNFEVEVIDDSKVYRVFYASNTASVARVTNNRCNLPLELSKGWNYICLDLDELVSKAFGRKYLATAQVRISGNCRVRTIYFQDEKYSDVELPDFLRVADYEEDF